MIPETQMPDRYRGLIEDQISVFEEGRSVQVVNSVPDTADVPIENPRHCLRIPDGVCVYVGREA